jgi:hypothetical protein
MYQSAESVFYALTFIHRLRMPVITFKESV